MNTRKVGIPGATVHIELKLLGYTSTVLGFILLVMGVAIHFFKPGLLASELRLFFWGVTVLGFVIGFRETRLRSVATVCFYCWECGRYIISTEELPLPIIAKYDTEEFKALLIREHHEDHLNSSTHGNDKQRQP